MEELKQQITLIRNLPNCPKNTIFHLSKDKTFYHNLIPETKENDIYIKQYIFTIQEVEINTAFFSEFTSEEIKHN